MMLLYIQNFIEVELNITKLTLLYDWDFKSVETYIEICFSSKLQNNVLQGNDYQY